MLLRGVLKCYLLYLLFDFCVADHRRISKIDKRVRSIRRSLETPVETDEEVDNNLESDKTDEDAEASKNENDENEEQGSNLEADESSKEKDEPGTVAYMTVTPKPDVTGSDKILEITKLSAMPGFDYSPAEVEKFKIWSQGIIPFYIDEFSYDKIVRDKIRELLDEASSLTGLRFLELPRPPADEKTRWVLIVNRRGQLECHDYTPNSFTNTGVQRLIIAYDCISAQYLAPLVLALAGVPPQHNSPDRDQYIEVSTNSIQPDKIDMFTAVKPEDWLFHDTKYDFLSAGHYPTHKYTVDGTATIVPKSKIDTFIGEADGLSYTDVVKIRMLYNFVLEKDDKNAKLPDCRALYRPGPNFKMIEVLDRHRVPARKKPKKYVEAAKQAGIDIMVGTENIPNVSDDDNVDKENNNNELNKTSNEDSSKDTDKIKENSNENKNNSENESLEESTPNESLKRNKSTASTANPMTMPDEVTSDE